MGIGKQIKRVWKNTKRFVKHIADPFHLKDKFFSKPKAPSQKELTPAQETQEGELEGASITLGSKRKKVALQKPRAKTAGATASGGDQSSVGLRI